MLVWSFNLDIRTRTNWTCRPAERNYGECYKQLRRTRNWTRGVLRTTIFEASVVHSSEKLLRNRARVAREQPARGRFFKGHIRHFLIPVWLCLCVAWPPFKRSPRVSYKKLRGPEILVRRSNVGIARQKKRFFSLSPLLGSANNFACPARSLCFPFLTWKREIQTDAGDIIRCAGLEGSGEKQIVK